MMFEGEDWQTLQTLINNCTITLGSQKTLQQVLDAIETTIKSEEHFWHFQDELSDVHQLPNKGIHALNTHITTLKKLMQIPSPWNPGDAQNHGPATCHAIPWSQGLDLVPWPVPVDLQGPSLTLPVARVSMQAVPKDQREGLGRPYLSHHHSLLSIIHPSRHQSSFLNCSKCGYSHPQINAQLKAESATTAVVRTITLPCVDTAKDPSQMTPDHPSI